MWVLEPIVLVANAYQVSLTLITVGSGKFADITGPVSDRWNTDCKESLGVGSDATREAPASRPDKSDVTFILQ